MLVKKSTIALCSSGTLPSTFSLPPHGSITSSPGCGHQTTAASPPSTSLRPRNKTRRRLSQPWQGIRTYATAQDGTHPDHSKPRQPPPPAPSDRNPAGVSSPPPWPTATHPTPYEIFAQTRKEPYSKKTYYQLVKLYHPDRHPHSSPSLSHATKLDRYRLVVAANTILSDPAKRRAYDLCGAGWGGIHDVTSKTARETDRAWRREPGNAARNATWEDWERWRNTGNESEKQNPLYMSNGLFIGALALFVVAGSWGQATRAGNHSVHLLEMREHTSHNISEDMWRRRREKAVLGREERIETFLRSREGWAMESSEDHMPKD